MSRELDPDGGWWIAGTYVGKELATGLFAEEVASRRFLIRAIETDPEFAVRQGEVVGGDGEFQALRMNGEHVTMRRSLLKAAQALRRTLDAHMPSA